jgi:sugar phosphate isomerase/epimerase
VKLGVFLAIYHDRPLEQALDRAVALGLDAVEIATGNYPGDAHCRPATAVDERAWRFHTIGCGHDAAAWRRILVALGDAGYDGVVSIEHEDRLLPADEGLARAVSLLAGIV